MTKQDRELVAYTARQLAEFCRMLETEADLGSLKITPAIMGSLKVKIQRLQGMLSIAVDDDDFVVV